MEIVGLPQAKIHWVKGNSLSTPQAKLIRLMEWFVYSPNFIGLPEVACLPL